MVTFTHLDSGTDERVWLSAAPWRAGTDIDVTGARALVVVVAHPDDETLAVGGTIATAASVGVPITVVVASDGEASHPRSTTTTPAALATRRRLEVTDAVRCLAPHAEVEFLGLPDGALSDAVSEIAHHVTRRLATRPGATVVSTWHDDGHPDHAAVADAVRQAAAGHARHLAAPIWLWHWGDPDTSVPWQTARTVRLHPAVREAKRAALTEHRSQSAPLSPLAGDEAILSPAFVAHFDRDVEVLFEVGDVS